MGRTKEQGKANAVATGRVKKKSKKQQASKNVS